MATATAVKSKTTSRTSGAKTDQSAPATETASRFKVPEYGKIAKTATGIMLAERAEKTFKSGEKKPNRAPVNTTQVKTVVDLIALLGRNDDDDRALFGPRDSLFGSVASMERHASGAERSDRSPVLTQLGALIRENFDAKSKIRGMKLAAILVAAHRAGVLASGKQSA